MVLFWRKWGWGVPLLLFLLALLSAVVSSQTVARAELAHSSKTEALSLRYSLTLTGSQLGLVGGVPPGIQSPAATLVSLDTGEVLYERNAHKRMPMASTTKIMTAILVLEKLDPETRVTISPKAAATYEPKSWVRAGDVLTVDELLYALLLRSANAAAVALAEASSGSVQAFVEEMNQKAAELGLRDTHFVNPHGLDDPAHYSTAADMAVLGWYAMQNERFRKYVSTKTYELKLPWRRTPLLLTNTNKLLHDYSWVIGVKTGLTPKAEQCLVAAGSRDGVEMLSVVLGQPVSDRCFEESRKLLEYGFREYRRVLLFPKGATLATAALPYRVDESVGLETAEELLLGVRAGDDVMVEIATVRALELPVAGGESYGEVRVKVGSEVVKTVALVADRSASPPTLRTKLAYGLASVGRWVSDIF